MTTIGKNMRQRRLALNMTLEEVAAKVGVSRQTMSRYETGVIKNYTPERVSEIASALNTTGSYLLGYTDDPDARPDGWAVNLPDGRTILTMDAPDIEVLRNAQRDAEKTLIEAVMPICGKKLSTMSGAEFTILDRERVETVSDFLKRNSDLLKSQIESQEKKKRELESKNIVSEPVSEKEE